MHRNQPIIEPGDHPLLARVAPHLTQPVAVVGGVVRDALLGRSHADDLDLVVEGDALPLAQHLGRALGVPVITHPRFGTAVLEMPDGSGHVDVVTCRREWYPHDGALPVVQPGTLADDLARRDFTINAMAVWVSGPDTGRLVDPTGGLADLRAGVVRALRADAFTEDPSRVVRAARYAGRLGFALDAATREAAAAVAPHLDWGSARVAEELRRLLCEPAPDGALGVLGALGAAGLRPDWPSVLPAVVAASARVGDPHQPGWAVRVGAVLDSDALAVVALPGWAVEAARAVQRGEGLAPAVARATRRSERDALLRDVPAAAWVGALAAGAEGVHDWWRATRGPVVAVHGGDLLAAGVPQGPAVGRALAGVRAAVLDGTVGDRDAQLALAVRLAGEG